MKKIVTALFAVAVLATLGACANSNTYSDTGSNGTLTSGAAMESHAERK
jgi:hypothetical protein